MNIRVLGHDGKPLWLNAAMIEKIEKDDEQSGHKIVSVKMESGAGTCISISNEVAKTLAVGQTVTAVIVHSGMECVIALIYDHGITRWRPSVRRKLEPGYYYFDPRQQRLPINSHGYFPGELEKLRKTRAKEVAR